MSASEEPHLPCPHWTTPLTADIFYGQLLIGTYSFDSDGPW